MRNRYQIALVIALTNAFVCVHAGDVVAGKAHNADAYPATILLAVDATDTTRGIFRIRESIPVNKPGLMTLRYPKWLPGYHAPTGPIDKLVGLIVRAAGKRIAWTRDPIDVYAFHVEVPEGATTLNLEFQYLSPNAPQQGRIVMTPEMLSVQWHTVALYPAGYPVNTILVAPSVTLPVGWQFATALETTSAGAGMTAFKAAPFDVLVDSPLFAGRHFRSIDLDVNGRIPVRLNMMADRPEQLAIGPEQLAAHRALVPQADKLFGSRHFDHYDFLLSISATVGEYGLEHHRSSENSVPANYFTAWDEAFAVRHLLAHEYVHSWNGKFRRSGGLLTSDFNAAAGNGLLWMYEGLTTHWGNVLAARSGLWSRQQALDALAAVAAAFEHRAGRQWRTLGDTTNDPIIATHGAPVWPSWQRSGDYYAHGQLLWLEIDMLIRELSAGRRSLDDFARAFFGIDGRAPGPVAYELDEVIRVLNQVQPHDWAALLRARLASSDEDTTLDGLRRGGYRLIYADTPSDYSRSLEAAAGNTDLTYSLGLTIASDGALRDVLWDGPAFAAGLTVGTRIVAVNDTAYDADDLKRVIAAAQESPAAIRLLVSKGDQHRMLEIHYRDGLRYPRLERIAGTPDRLSAMLAPR